MGMDVYGRSPQSETGKYFRNNVWWWRPLADYCVQVAPAICARCQYWQSNDGDGLDAEHARVLADALQDEIDSGRCEAFAKIYEAEQAAVPNEPCGLCDATGVRRPAPERGAGDAVTGIKCNACDGPVQRR
jgi:hypothetical protein